MCPARQLIELILKQKDMMTNAHNKWPVLTLNNSIKKMVQELLHDYGLVAIVRKEGDQKLKGDLRNELDLTKEDSLSQMLNQNKTNG